jgi:branched-chain amino acid aminotransferase
MHSPLAYLNGQLLPFTEAALPLHDAGFVTGATIVDNARTFRHKLFRWPDHLDRFRRDCESCYIPIEQSNEQLSAAATELVEHNAKLLPPSGELQLITFATPGPLGLYLGEATNGPATLGMVTYPLPFGRYRRFFTEGVSLAVAGHQSSDPDDLLPPRVKHRSRLSWYIAERTINDPASAFYNPGAIPVVLNQQGGGDTAIGCVLAVRDGAIIRPDPETVLDSISAKVVGELPQKLGLCCEDMSLDLRQFCLPPKPGDDPTSTVHWSELLLVGTGFCVAGVRRFSSSSQGRDYDWPGPVYSKLIAAWSEMVSVDIAGQFMSQGG